MSGRFHRSWADFGGLKHPNQLLSEMPAIIAHGAQCDLGDQLPPDGRLDPAVYATIAPAYEAVRTLEPFLEQAVPVTEAAILVQGMPLEELGSAMGTHGANGAASYGLTKLLMECHVQFDIVEPDIDLGRYRLLVLADGLVVDQGLAARLETFLASGGAIIASHEAIRLAGSEQSWHTGLAATYLGESPYKPAYLKLGGRPIWAHLPDYEYALYEGTARWSARQESTIALVGEPLFQRSAEHYTSHAQSPFDHLTSEAAVLLHERFAAAAFPIGASYYRTGYWIYREVFRRLLEAVLPERLIRTSAPLSAEVTLTHQQEAPGRPERWMVHVVNFSPNRRSPEHCEYLEDPIPLRDVRVRLSCGRAITRVVLGASGQALPLTPVDGGWETVVPEVRFGEIVVFEE